MISPNLTQAEELLRSNNHRAAQAVLASIERPTDLPRREYGYYCILLAETCLRTGNYKFDTLDQAIEIFRFHKDSEKFARANYLRGWQQAALGQHREAEETLLESYAAYRRCRDAGGAARVLNRLSYVLLQLGSIDSAIANIRKSGAGGGPSCVMAMRRQSPGCLTITYQYIHDVMPDSARWLIWCRVRGAAQAPSESIVRSSASGRASTSLSLSVTSPGLAAADR